MYGAGKILFTGPTRAATAEQKSLVRIQLRMSKIASNFIGN
jgi:hypothetical protein